MQRGAIPGGSGSVRSLRIYGDPVLHARAREVTEEDGPLGPLAEDLFATMYAHRGVGLAAPQIGVPLRVFVFDCPDDEDTRHRGVVVNPRLVSAEGFTVRGPEGCLSLPGLEAGTPRFDTAVVEGLDAAGAPVRIEGTGFFARCLQHEYDHLEGTLYPGRLSGLRLRRLMRQVNKAPWYGRTGRRVPASRPAPAGAGSQAPLSPASQPHGRTSG